MSAPTAPIFFISHQMLSARAVDAHTAHHLYYECLKGDLMRGRTVVLVSHHVQLCTPGADYVVALDNGRVLFQGAREAFQASDVLSGLVQSGAADADAEQDAEPETIEADLKVLDEEAHAHAHAADASGGEPASETSSTAVTSVSAEAKADRKAPRKLVEEEKRAVGRIERSVWDLYIRASGGAVYWVVFALVLLLAAAGPVAENGWLSVWSGASGASGREPRTPMFYIVVYASVGAWSCRVMFGVL